MNTEIVVEDGIEYLVTTLESGTVIKFPNAPRINDPIPDSPPDEVSALKAQIEDLKAQLDVTNATVDFLLGI